MAYNVHYCYTKNPDFLPANDPNYDPAEPSHVQAPCANNCRGVDPNSIIGGGAAAVVASGLAAQFLGPAGLGAAGIAGEDVLVVRVSLII